MCKENHFKMESQKNAKEISLNAYINRKGVIRESEKSRQQLNCHTAYCKFSTYFGTMNDVTFIETVGSFKKYI